MDTQEMRKLRDEILTVLAAHEGTGPRRTARAMRDGLTAAEYSATRGGAISPYTAGEKLRRCQAFLEGELPYTRPSMAPCVAVYYRDALNFADRLSVAALLYARIMLAELREIDPTIPTAAYKSVSTPVRSDSTARRQPATCEQCFTQHAGECA